MERTIICISRQYGSGGREIGEAVAKKLGIPCYDKCLIQKAAQEAGLSETAVAEYDEKGEDFGIAVSGNPFADTAALGEAFYSEEARVFEAERRVIQVSQAGTVLVSLVDFSYHLCLLRDDAEFFVFIFFIPIESVAGNLERPDVCVHLPAAPDVAGDGWTAILQTSRRSSPEKSP